MMARCMASRRWWTEHLEARLLLSSYFVSAGGSDADPGTLAAPFGTIARGMQAAQPGDTVFLRGGTYRETLSSVRSGLPGQPITVASYNNEVVYLSASDVVDGPWTETAPGSGIYSAAVNSTLPPSFWSPGPTLEGGTNVTERDGAFVATVVNETGFTPAYTRSALPSSAWDLFAQPVTWRVRDIDITSIGSTPLPPNQANIYFSVMPEKTKSAFGGEDAITVKLRGSGRLELLLKKDMPSDWGNTIGYVINTAITGFDLTVGPGAPGNVSYSLVAYPTGQTVATGQWAITPADWSDGGDGSTSYVEMFAQETATATNDLNQKFEVRVGSYEISAGATTILRDTFSDNDLTTIDYFPAGWDTSISSGYDQVFVNGEMQHEARYPNRSTSDLLAADGAALTMNDSYAVSGAAFAGQPAGFFAGARFLGRVGAGRSWQTAVVASNDGSGLQLDSAKASTPWWPNDANKASDPGTGYVYGKLAFLDADREWYLQPSGDGPDVLYVRLPGGADPAGHTVEHKVRNWTVNISGHSNIVIQGLRLRGGAVRLEGSGLTLQDCDARYLSHYQTFANGERVDGGFARGSGIVVSGSGNTVQRNTIYDTAGSGIVASGTGHLLTRNDIHHVDYSSTYAAGMDLTGTGHTVTFNTIRDAGRNLLNASGGGLAVMYNDLSRSGRLTLDLGAIYAANVNGADLAGRKTRIAYNWVHERGNPSDASSRGIYFDAYDRNFIADHNVIWGYTDTSYDAYNPTAIRLDSPTFGIELYHNTIIHAPAYNVSTSTTFPSWNPDASLWTTSNHAMDYTAQNNWVVSSSADPATLFVNYAGQDFRAGAGTAAVDPTAAAGVTDWTTTDGVTNVPAEFKLWARTKNQTFRYHEVTGQGIAVAGINDGFVGATPDSGAYEAGGNYWIPGVNGTLSATPPTLTSASINGGAVQRSMVRQVSVAFSEPVNLGSGAVTVRLSSGAAIPSATITLSNPSADQRTYLLTFSGSAVIGGSLPDGVYDLVITASGVKDINGAPLTASYTQRFHRLFGDNNGDRRVNLLDYRALRTTLGRSNGSGLFNDALDYDGGGSVNVLDLTQFRRRFGQRMMY